MRRANRLRAPDEFSLVYRDGIRARAATVTTIAATGDGVPRIGVVCSRKVGNAPLSNRIKRRIRAAVDPVVDDLRPGVLVVLQGQPAAASAPFGELRSEIRDGLRRAGALDE